MKEQPLVSGRQGATGTGIRDLGRLRADGSPFVAYVQHGVGGGTGSIILFRGL